MRRVNPRQMEFFDRSAETWDLQVQHDPAKVGKIAEILGVEPGDRVLDVGTGTGIMLPHMLDMVGPQGEVIGLDYSERMLEVARQKFPPGVFPNLRLVRGDASLVDPLGVDRVMCYSVFPHFVDQRGTLKNLVRGMRPGGTLVVAHSSSREEINGIHIETGREVANDFLPTMEEMMLMFMEAGLVVRMAIDDEECFVIVGKRDGGA